MHVWLAAMPQEWQAGQAILSCEERTRAAKFVFERDRAHYTFHHTALRMILAGYTGLAPGDVPVVSRAGEKPTLAAPYEHWRFNLSHAGPVALIAVSAGCEVGVDVERLRSMPDALSIAERFFSPAERDALATLDAAGRDAAFFACWTRKEAFIKATGEGLRRSLDSFDVPLDAALPAPWRIGGRWTIVDLPPVPGYASALAVEGDIPAVYGWEFTLQGA